MLIKHLSVKLNLGVYFAVGFLPFLPPPISSSSAGAFPPHGQKPRDSVREEDLTHHSITHVSQKPVILLLTSLTAALLKTKVWTLQLLTDGRSSYPTVIRCKREMTPTGPFLFPFFHNSTFTHFSNLL